MPRRPAVLLTPPHAISASSLFCTFCTVLQKSEAHPLSLQPLPRSLQKHGRWHQQRSPNSSSSLATHSFTLSFEGPLSSLEATLTADLRVGFQGCLATLPEKWTEISRTHPPTSALDATLTDFTPVTPLSATLTKTPGGVGDNPGATTRESVAA